MINSILEYDRSLFKIINFYWSNSFFDWLMPFLRNSKIWIPLYFFLLLFAIINFKKNAIWWILFSICTVIISNFISSNIIKENIIRIRPCNEPSISSWIKILVNYKPQSSSFTSSHATNHFAMATFFFITLKKEIKNWAWLFFIWAFCISFAQIYVGVHYPLDILCGALIGFLIGYLCAKLFNKQFYLT